MNKITINNKKATAEIPANISSPRCNDADFKEKTGQYIYHDGYYIIYFVKGSFNYMHRIEIASQFELVSVRKLPPVLS
jgi:hypothetical protein